MKRVDYERRSTMLLGVTIVMATVAALSAIYTKNTISAWAAAVAWLCVIAQLVVLAWPRGRPW
jgi:hypothetical protein